VEDQTRAAIFRQAAGKARPARKSWTVRSRIWMFLIALMSIRFRKDPYRTLGKLYGSGHHGFDFGFHAVGFAIWEPRSFSIQ
jgi:hypothetical protein